ncbi:GNAT family N-acetyltransferase [Candidatus Nitrotoga arctica]|uniref:N-acetyltransferase domain-containing protein n=1 Tax=Candidatus Nitrotoga arctica TaxID=453162 RepID=A0ABM8Z2V2_9PROT|nr:GNAT family N-acetyltransferase [Candidatus Nitrotoga arctica]CAG9934233.1 protein of unknown function [Candidatus Nitrotoga arctica]
MEPTVVARRVRPCPEVETDILRQVAHAFQFYVKAARNMCIDTFRIASNSDSEVIAKLVNEAYRPESGASGWTHESDLVAGSRTSASQIAETLSKLNSVILVGLKDSKIVACVQVEKDRSNSHIGMLAVRPALQGVGAGKQMLFQAERYAFDVFGAENSSWVLCPQEVNSLPSIYGVAIGKQVP